MPDLECQSHHDVADGYLNSTQSVEWDGAPLPADQRAALAARMDEEHVAAVGGSLWKFLRCRVRDGNVVCSGFGLVPLLTFGDAVTTMAPHSVRRRWAVTGGLLARPGDAYGCIRFEWTQTALDGGAWRHQLTATVEGYPSRFLHANGAAPHWLRHVGGWYTGYHRRVTCGFLRRLARWVRAAAGEG